MEDVFLSPGQLIAVASEGGPERMIHASEVATGRLAFDRSLGMVAYYEFVLPEPAQICIAGLWTVSHTDDAPHDPVTD